MTPDPRNTNRNFIFIPFLILLLLHNGHTCGFLKDLQQQGIKSSEPSLQTNADPSLHSVETKMGKKNDVK